jgi:RimJ/RimL family protein N-acetyltransferase
MPDFKLRPAALGDAELLWNWRKDPGTHSGLETEAPASFDEHVAWLTNILKQSDSLMWILEVDHAAVGAIWYERRELGAAEVSFVVEPTHRGQGYSAMLLRMSTPEAIQSLGVRRLFGIVPTHNERAMRAFLAAEWRCVGWRGRGYSSAAFEYRPSAS